MKWNRFAALALSGALTLSLTACTGGTTATTDIPVPGTSITEYGVALGIDGFDGVVGNNVSGTSDLAPLDRQAAMVKEWFPDAQNVELLYYSAEPNSRYQVDQVQKYLEQDGITVPDGYLPIEM